MKYILIDEEGTVTGTDDEAIAEEFKEYDQYLVVNQEDGTCWNGRTWKAIPVQESYEEQEEQEDEEEDGGEE